MPRFTVFGKKDYKKLYLFNLKINPSKFFKLGQSMLPFQIMAWLFVKNKKLFVELASIFLAAISSSYVL